MLPPDESSPALMDYQPWMFAGVHSHDGTNAIENVRLVGETANPINIPIRLSTVAATSLSGSMIPEIISILLIFDQ